MMWFYLYIVLKPSYCSFKFCGKNYNTYYGNNKYLTNNYKNLGGGCVDINGLVHITKICIDLNGSKNYYSSDCPNNNLFQ